MKNIILTIFIALTLTLPTAPLFAAETIKVKLVPIKQYVLEDMQRFENFVARPDLTRDELAEALEDLSQVLSVYLRSL